MKHFAGVFLAVSLIMGLSACGGAEEKPQDLQIIAMDTAMTFRVYGGEAHQALSDASLEMRRLEALLSRTDPNSAVSQLNAAGGDEVPVGKEVCDLLRAADTYAQATGGAFDVTLAPVSSAWGFTENAYRVPSREEREQLLDRVGMEHITLKEETAALTPGAAVDLGAIAKGYAADQVAVIFDARGVERGWASLGGNVLAWGGRPDGTAWQVGIQDPAHPDDANALVGTLKLKDAYAVTSGSYQRFFEDSGRRYHHIMDPATAAPAESGLISVTVVTGRDQGNGTMCDALSTALFVMGEERAVDFWRSGIFAFQMILVTEDGRVCITSGLEDAFELGGDGYVLETLS